MNKRVLLINDLVGYGKLSMTAMIPLLSHLGYQTFNLPTSLVSNNFGYGKYKLLDTTDYMRDSIRIWEELGFEFDAVCTGFICNREQMDIITDFCSKQREKGAKILVDPVMADEGALYAGLDSNIVELMKGLIGMADCIVPNYTEAALLTDSTYSKEPLAEKDIYGMLDRLMEHGTRSAIITSCLGAKGSCVAGYDCTSKGYFTLPYDNIPVYFSGTGDLFSAFLLSGLLKGRSLQTSTRYAMDSVRTLIEKNIDYKDKYNGIPLETCFDLVKEL